MLQQFSWVQFLIAASLLCFLWYVFVLLVFYRAEINAFLGGSGSGTIGSGGSSRAAKPSAKAIKREDKQIELEVDAALMGTSRLPDWVELKSSSQVSFAGSVSDGKYEYKQLNLYTLDGKSIKREQHLNQEKLPETEVGKDRAAKRSKEQQQGISV